MGEDRTKPTMRNLDCKKSPSSIYPWTGFFLTPGYVDYLLCRCRMVEILFPVKALPSAVVKPAAFIRSAIVLRP